MLSSDTNLFSAIVSDSSKPVASVQVPGFPSPTRSSCRSADLQQLIQSGSLLYHPPCDIQIPVFKFHTFTQSALPGEWE